MKEPSCPVHIYIELDTTLHDEYAIVAYCNTVLPYEDLSQLWPVVVVCGFCGRGHHLGLLCAARILVAIVGWSWYFVGRLLLFLDGWDHVALHGGNVVAKQTWVVIGQCVQVVGGILGMVVVG